MARKPARSRRQIANQKRKIEVSALKPKIFLFSEGRVTETLYLTSLARRQNTYAIDVISSGKNPETLLKDAIAFQKKYNRQPAAHKNKDDQFWIVFDQDELPDAGNLIRRITSSGFAYGYSNPCFEIFLLFHFEQFDGVIGRLEIKRRLATRTNEYCGTAFKLKTCARILDNVTDAIQRSKESVDKRKEENNDMGEPCSTLGKLLSEIHNNATARR